MVLTMLSICNSWFTGIIVAHIDKAWGAKRHPNTFQEWQLTVLLYQLRIACSLSDTRLVSINLVFIPVTVFFFLVGPKWADQLTEHDCVSVLFSSTPTKPFKEGFDQTPE